MKICLDARYLVKSGSSSYIAHIVPRILALDKETQYYLVKYPEQSFPFESEMAGIFVCRSRFNTTRLLWTMLVLPIRLWMSRIDVYHGMKFPGPYWCTSKVVNTVHSISSKYKGWFPRSFRSQVYQVFADPITRRSDAIIAVSRFLSDFTIESIKADRKKVHVVYHGVDESFRLVDKAAVQKAKDQFGITKKYFICVGNVFKVKNQITALRAFAEIANEFNGDLVIAGGTHDDYCEQFKQEARRLGVEERVMLLGFVNGDALTALMNGAVASLLPSLTEGFGMAMLEAFRCGLPVIAANVGSLTELGENCAILIDNPMDHKGFANAMRKLLSSPEFAEEIRLRSAERGTKFTWEAAASEHVRIYHAVGAKRR